MVPAHDFVRQEQPPRAQVGVDERPGRGLTLAHTFMAISVRRGPSISSASSSAARAMSGPASVGWRCPDRRHCRSRVATPARSVPSGHSPAGQPIIAGLGVAQEAIGGAVVDEDS